MNDTNDDKGKRPAVTSDDDLWHQLLSDELEDHHDKGYSASFLAYQSLLGVTLASVAIMLPFLVVPWLPAKKFGSLPYMHTPVHKIKTLFGKSLPRYIRQHGSDDKRSFIDLGSGAGEAVIEAARQGYHARGVELNPSLYLFSLYNAWKSGYSSRTSFVLGNMLTTPIHNYDVIMVFGVRSLMSPIRRKLLKEGKDGALVVLYRFCLPEDNINNNTEDDGQQQQRDKKIDLLEVQDEMSIYRISRDRNV